MFISVGILNDHCLHQIKILLNLRSSTDDLRRLFSMRLPLVSKAMSKVLQNATKFHIIWLLLLLATLKTRIVNLLIKRSFERDRPTTLRCALTTLRFWVGGGV